jgi:hypothetical protein
MIVGHGSWGFSERPTRDPQRSTEIHWGMKRVRDHACLAARVSGGVERPGRMPARAQSSARVEERERVRRGARREPELGRQRGDGSGRPRSQLPLCVLVRSGGSGAGERGRRWREPTSARRSGGSDTAGRGADGRRAAIQGTRSWTTIEGLALGDNHGDELLTGRGRGATTMWRRSIWGRRYWLSPAGS